MCGCKTAAAAAAAFDNIITTGVASTSPRSEWRGGREEAAHRKNVLDWNSRGFTSVPENTGVIGPGTSGSPRRLPPKASAPSSGPVFVVFFWAQRAWAVRTTRWDICLDKSRKDKTAICLVNFKRYVDLPLYAYTSAHVEQV